MRIVKRIFFLLLVLIITGCTVTGTYMNPNIPAPKYTINGQVVRVDYAIITPTLVQNFNAVHFYRIGPYDILNIIVWDHPELTTPTTQMTTPVESGTLVSEDGLITFPFAGTFKVAGLSIPEAQQVIAQHLSKYVRNPQVSVRIVAFRSQEVQVMGEIGGVKTIPLADKPLTLLDAINGAGGTNVMSANTTKIFVIRGSLRKLTVFALDAQSPQNMMAAQRFVLKNNDIIYVPPLSVTDWNRVFSQLFPFFATGLTTAATVKAF